MPGYVMHDVSLVRINRYAMPAKYIVINLPGVRRSGR